MLDSMREIKTEQASTLAVMELTIQEKEFMTNIKISSTENNFFKTLRKVLTKH